MANTISATTPSIGQNPNIPSGTIQGAEEVFRYLRDEVRPQILALENAIRNALNQTGDIVGHTNNAILLLQDIFDRQPKLVQLDAAHQIENFAMIEQRLNSVISVFENKHSDRENELVELARRLKEEVSAASYVAQNALRLEGKDLNTIKSEIASETNTKISGALSEARAYTDAQILSAVAQAANTAENLAKATLSAANAYADSRITSAKADCIKAMSGISSALTSGLTTLDTQINTKLNEAKEQLTLLSETIQKNEADCNNFIVKEYNVFKANIERKFETHEANTQSAVSYFTTAISGLSEHVMSHCATISDWRARLERLDSFTISATSGISDILLQVGKNVKDIEKNTQDIENLRKSVSAIGSLPTIPTIPSGGGTTSGDGTSGDTTDPNQSGSGTTSGGSTSGSGTGDSGSTTNPPPTKPLEPAKETYIGYIYRDDLQMIRSLGTTYDTNWRLLQASAAMSNTTITDEYQQLCAKNVFKDIYPCVINIAEDRIVKLPKATESAITAELNKNAKNSLMIHFPKVFVIYGTLTCNAKQYEILAIDTQPFTINITPDMLFMGEKSNAAITFTTLLNPSALSLEPLGKVKSGNNTASLTLQACLHPAFYSPDKICDEIWLSAYWVTKDCVCKPMGYTSGTREEWNTRITEALDENFGKMRLMHFWDWHLISLIKRAGSQRQAVGRNAYAESTSAHNLRGHPSEWQMQNNVDSLFGLFNMHITTYPTLLDGVFITESASAINVTYLPTNYNSYNDCQKGSVVYQGSAIHVGYINTASVNAPTSVFKSLGNRIFPLFDTAKQVRSTSFRSRQTATNNTAGFGLTQKNALIAARMTNASVGLLNGCYGLFHVYAATTGFYARMRYHHLRNRKEGDVLF
ncbi:MAG: hypothetical protein K2N12_01290 [Helicobacter sp.]|nr:hypothetical protein [Helicobacter sp.]